MKSSWLTWMTALMLVLVVGALAAGESEDTDRASFDLAGQAAPERLAQAR
jgi:hypothetical protein